MSFIHIMRDEKFNDFAIQQFEEVAPNQNKYIILTNNQSELYYTQNKDKTKPINIKKDEFKLLANSLPSYKVVFIHYLDDWKEKLIAIAPPETTFVWMFWGQDAQKLFYDNSYLFKTRLLVLKLLGIKEFTWPYHNWIRRLILPFTQRGRVLKRISFCCPVIEEEFELMKRKLKLNMKMIPFTYGSIDENFKDCASKMSNGKNIMIGNSATFSSNHLDAFNCIKKANILTDNKKLIVPLSYGNNSYRDIIINRGEQLFGDKFVPLTNYVKLSDFIEYLSDCSALILFHIRQQALGNILIALNLGLKIYMHPKSILYKSLKKKGFVIYSTSDINTDNLNSELDQSIIKKNRTLVYEYYGNKAVIDKTRFLIHEAQQK